MVVVCVCVCVWGGGGGGVVEGTHETVAICRDVVINQHEN